MAPPTSGAVPSLDEVHALPKVELHAHLSGSISQQKLVELLARRGNGDAFETFDCREHLKSEDTSKSLAKCFEYFDKVSRVVSDLATLRECALHVLDGFAEDGCLYLELRTSPKQFGLEGGQGTTKRQYLETVSGAVEEFRAYAQRRFGFVMEVGLLLSVDRGRVSSLAEARRQVDDALTLAETCPELVVGVDVSGDPSRPSVVPYLIPALLERREAFRRLPITFHTAEVADEEESELIVRSLRELNIRRLGHVCFLPEPCRQRLLAGGHLADGAALGIELCPTSNAVTRRLARLEDHHFPDWWRQSDCVLVSVNTDDAGLFSCSLSGEVHGMAEAFGLSREDVVELQRQALLSSFHRDKAALLATFRRLLSSSGRGGAVEAQGALPTPLGRL